jgi:hypothetical protein
VKMGLAVVTPIEMRTFLGMASNLTTFSEPTLLDLPDSRFCNKHEADSRPALLSANAASQLVLQMKFFFPGKTAYKTGSINVIAEVGGKSAV